MSETPKDKLVKILDAALAPPPPRPVSFEDLARTIAVMCPGLASKQVLAKLIDLQQQFQRAFDTMMAHTVIESKKAWLANEKSLKDAVRTGTIGTRDGWSRIDWEEDYSRKMLASKEAMRDISRESLEFTRELAQKFKDFCDSLANGIQDREITDCQKFGLPHEPSNLVNRLRETGRLAFGKTGGNGSPRQQLPWLEF